MIRRGELYWLKDRAANSHPHVVVQDDVLNDSPLSTVVVCALSSNLQRAKERGNVLLEAGEGGLPKQSVVLVAEISSLEKSQLGERIGALAPARVGEIFAGLRFQQAAYAGR